MSGWSGIFFRYDVEDRKFEKQNYKGLIGNLYKGFRPYNIFVRATEGVEAAMGQLTHITYCDVNTLISRTLDVDFVGKWVELSFEAKNIYEIEKEKDAQNIGESEIRTTSTGINANPFFFTDCNYYGGFLVDVKGYVNERVEGDDNCPTRRKHDLKIKYAFLDNTYLPERIMSARQYVECFANLMDEKTLGVELFNEINRILAECDDGVLGELMTVEEVAEYMSKESVEDYLSNIED